MDFRFPTTREIIAAHIRDRVVHHFIYDYMSPYWERRFSNHSYACRKNKGPLKAVQDVRAFIRGYRQHATKPLYYLKVDIASFFPTIDLVLLRQIILKKLTHPLYRYLVDVTLRHRPVERGNFVLKSPQTNWQQIPRHKSMFYAPSNKGLPIGNLTSQFFANVYLNELDQFITHQLQGSFLYWHRYVDDILFLADSAEALKNMPRIINDFLSKRLALQLNPSKTLLQPLDRGIDHLGYWIKPDHMLIRQKNVRTCFEKMGHLAQKKPEELQAVLNSYLGHFRQADSVHLRARVAERMLRRKICGGRLVMCRRHQKVQVKPDKSAEAHCAAKERQLVAEFRNYFKEGQVKGRAKSYLKEWRSLAPLLQDAQAFLVDDE